VSPYSPLSRYYNNLIYLDLEAVPEYEKIGKGKISGWKKSQLRKKKFVDYGAIYSLKYRALKEMFKLFSQNEMSGGRGSEFRAYTGREGKTLEDYSTFMALDEFFKGGGWMSWPPEFQDPDGAKVRKFRKKNPEAVLFHSYVQWLLDVQLRGLNERTKKRGMRAGLYFDLAVGSLGGGADAWSNRDVFASGADAGAPPDDFNLTGQNWGFPPLIPEKLRETGYNVFIKTLRKNLEHAGVLRIDHALGLFRFFWIPAGLKPADGAYVRYPHEEMLAIAAIESRRANAVIVAEDLGTAGGEVRAALSRAKMLSYRLFYYERKYPSPEFVEPGHYPEAAFCAVTTHDLPTLAGFWRGCDIREKKALSLYPSRDSWRNDLKTRKRDKELIISTLKKEGLLPENYRMPGDVDDKLVLAVHGYLARTPSLLASVSLDDWLKSREQQNLPGVTGDYPNWRRKTPVPIEEFAKGGAPLRELFRKEGRGHPV
jgi:(1->4)-alpha-D-glucan 1-alpha-D-glucosylmutase